jgi:hypothetical protein
MVRHIQSDEKPHVEYLRTALSEARARTLRTVGGKTIAGREVVDGLMHRILRTVTRDRPRDQREDLRASFTEAMKGVANPARLIEEFDALESKWAPPERTGFEPLPA